MANVLRLTCVLLVVSVACGQVDATPPDAPAIDAPAPDATTIDAAPATVDAGTDASTVDAPPAPIVMFAETFDAIGAANLVGQFGWTGQATVPLGTTGLGGRGVAGRTSPGASTSVAVASHAVAWQPGHHYEVRYRARASSDAPASENTGLFVAAPGDGAVGSGWEYVAGQWRLNLNYLAGGLAPPVAIRDGAAVEFELHLDTVAQTVWGAYTVDGARTETSRYQLIPARFAALTGVLVFVDYRSSTVGAEFDDLRVMQW